MIQVSEQIIGYAQCGIDCVRENVDVCLDAKNLLTIKMFSNTLNGLFVDEKHGMILPTCSIIFANGYTVGFQRLTMLFNYLRKWSTISGVPLHINKTEVIADEQI